MIPLLDQNHREAARLVRTGAPVFLTINPVEYHGPHLSLHNDRLVSLGLAKALHAKLCPDQPFLLGADLEVGVDPVPGPGSRHVPFATVRTIIVEACRALAELGAQRVVLMTFHGSPLHALALDAGVQTLQRLGVKVISPLNIVMQEMLTVDASHYAEAFAPIANEADRRAASDGLAMDFHGGFFETSMALHLAPESVSPDHVNLPPCPDFAAPTALAGVAKLASGIGARHLGIELGFAATALGWYALRPFPGYTGRPHLASARSGAAFTRAIIERYAALAEEVFSGRALSPQPIMRWTLPLSLGGRLPGPGVPADEVRRLTAGT
ncbi:MAG: creatininase family protein [Deltaproteobacteria bacterium]|nr:creatininase family protein [Deltaproteobacteria bacterium]